MSLTELTELTYERRGDAGWLTFDNPERRNALSRTMVTELHRVLDVVEADATVRSLVLTGNGSVFCAGADLTFFLECLNGGGVDAFMDDFLVPLVDVLRRLRNLPLPTVAAVNGPCIAGGMETILCVDLVIASTKAIFGDAHSRHGILPAIGAVGALVRSAGAHRAKRMMMLSEMLDAHALVEYGIVTEVLEPDELLPRAEALAAELALRSPASMALMKASVQRSEEPDWETHVAADLVDFRAIWGTPQMREGITAYNEKRQASYSR
jgi:enoyl-CoA hydratase/carnithine racemase